jgi:hypothetical protein
LAAPFKSKGRLEAENAALRHQLIVLRRKMPGRVRLTNNDRWFLIQVYRWPTGKINRTPFLADFITITCGFRFPVHTGEWLAGKLLRDFRQLVEAQP